ncbi:MAG: CCA tRNA nucleotidyltransferase [Sedimentibacter sp.]
MNININIPSEVETALSILNKNNFEAYIVGGCVRDSLLGAVPNDWDITTSAKPDEISDCFQNFRIINTGLKHGTVTVLIGKMQLEITTYRIDGKYTDNRRPDSVLFTNNVSNDLRRRDFTINALAYNKGGIVDLFGGIDDIENKIIKCVGEPDERFNEDGLRILRALRFASVLQFNIDINTSSSIHKNKYLLNNISKERISNEFSKLLMGSNFHNIMSKYKDVIEVFIPEVVSYNGEIWESILNTLYYADDLVLRLALLLHKTNNAENILKNLKYDGTTTKKVNSIVSNKDIKIIPDKINIKKQLNIIGNDNYINLIKCKTAIYKTQKEKFKEELINIKNVEDILNNIVMHKECYNLKMLAINGEDLIREGFSKGIILGSILNDILCLVIEEKLENNKDVLMKYVKKYKKIKN